MYTAECEPAKYWKLISWINVMSRQWQELALCPHSDLVSYSPSDWNKISPTRIIVDDTKIPFQRTKTSGFTMIYLFYISNRNTVKVLFGCSTGGLVSYLSPAYGGSDVTINVPTFFKEKK